MTTSKHKKTFYLQSGETFKDLQSFAKKLPKMTEDVFKHHVNPKKNDFANWVRNSLNEKELADKLDKFISKTEIELEVLRHLINSKSSKTSSSKSPSTKKTSTSSNKKTSSSSSSNKKTTSKSKSKK